MLTLLTNLWKYIWLINKVRAISLVCHGWWTDIFPVCVWRDLQSSNWGQYYIQAYSIYFFMNLVGIEQALFIHVCID